MTKASQDGFSKFTFAESAAPDTPAIGLLYVYVKTDGKLYTKNDAGTEICLSEKLNNPMTSAGDLIYGGADGAPTRLEKGTAGQVLQQNAGETAPEWADSPLADYELIASWVHSSDVTSIDIPIPSGASDNYGAILVVANIRTDRAANVMESIQLRFSTGETFDTGGNYHTSQVETGDGSNTAHSATATALYIGRCYPASGADANVFAHLEFGLTGWDDSSTYVNLRGHVLTLATSGTYRHDEIYGTWKNTGIVDGLRFLTVNSSNMIAGSWIKVYGLAK